MRNLVVHRETQLGIAPSSEMGISCVCSDNMRGVLVACSQDGYLVETPLTEGLVTAWDISSSDVCRDVSWFFCSSVIDTNSLLCVSHTGQIITVSHSAETGQWEPQHQVEGVVDSGILAAQWNPDQSCLALFAGDGSLIVMSPQLDVLYEVCVPPASEGSPRALSWSGDGDMCAVYSEDAADCTARIRVYSKSFELLAEGRGVAEGAAGVIKDLCPVVAFAPNASLVAGVQKKSSGKHQVVFFERNGLRHGEFDVQVETVVSVAAPLQSWAPLSLHFDLSSVMLAVGFRSSSNAAVNSVVQLYYRENFHWYLKQQWCGEGLTCHGFDSEVSGRLFLSETVRSLPEGRCVVRTIDLVWEATASLTAECTISVADGCEVHLTPLGLAVVPPPMSLYRTPCLTDPPRHLSFWTKLSSATGGNFATPLLFPDGWGLCCLCDRNVLFLFTGVATTSSREIGALESTGPLPLGSLLQSAGLVGGTCRQALALEQQAASAGVIDRTVNVVLLVSCPRVVSPVPSSSGLLQSFAEDTSQDVLLYVAVVMRGSKGDSSAAIEYVGKLVMDRCIVTSIVHWGAQGRNEVDAEGGDVTAPALFPFVTGAAYIAVAVCRTDSSFAVIRIKTPFAERTTTPVEHTLFVDEAAPSLHMIPEMCHKVVVSVPAGSEVGGLTRRTAVIGLSMRNHLYCGEILIATGVNSFCLNSPLGTLMYATVGTRPTLNFIDLNALHQLDPMQSVDDLVLSWGAAEPRPLERGARLVASVPAAARVILQMPRGNFETCEPRHLALKRARLMMDASSFFECLAFLRRQRIDLNLLFDYNADKFLAGVPSLVAQCLELNPDLLSLLISSLEAGDVTRSKYALDFGAVQTWSKFPIVTRPDKVDSICRAIRNGILGYMLRHDKNFRGSVQLDSSSYVNPIMCTYARQRPPRLKEALSIIKAESMGVLQGINDSLSVDQAGPEGVDTLAEELQRRIDQGSGSPQPALSRGKPQALIKYLAFLVNKEELFNAALGECDFSMARAIAKQCQMDPKAYLPLLEAFESVGSEWTEADGCVGSLKAKRTCHMKFRIFVHLNDFTSAVTWGIRGISCSSYFLLEKDSTCVIATSEVDLYNDVFETIENHELHMTSIAHIRALLSGQELMYVSGTDAKRLPSSSAGYAELLRMLSAILISHGSRAVAMGQYRQALTAFLAAEPPDFGRAIVAAKNAKDWKLAIALAGRAALQSCSENRDDIPTPKELALSIIEEFEAGLEQGMSEEEDYFSSFPCSLDFSAMSVVNTAQAANAESGGEASTSTSLESEEDRSVEVALLCVEYLDGDLDRAAAILIAGRKWAQVAQMMFRFCRVDLVQQVGEYIRAAANEALAALAQRTARHLTLCSNLKTCWTDTQTRLRLVVESDPQLAQIMERERRPVQAGWAGAVDDAIATGDSNSVVNEQRSVFSRASNMSFASGASVRSGVSTVSVLSNLSRASAASTASDTSFFSVRGLEHSLLSRGTAYDTSDGSKSAKSIEKKKKRHERHLKGNKGGAHGGADIYNLKGENAWCTELCRYCDIKVVASAVADLRDALLLLGDPRGDIDLAIRLQRAMTDYATIVVSNPPPSAPLYPVEWLRRKSMEHVRCFQEWPAVSHDAVITMGSTINVTVHSLLWWKVAADGIIFWRTLKNNMLDA